MFCRMVWEGLYHKYVEDVKKYKLGHNFPLKYHKMKNKTDRNEARTLDTWKKQFKILERKTIIVWERNDMICTTKGMSLKNIMLNESSYSKMQKTTLCMTPFIWNVKQPKTKSVEIPSRLVMTWGWGWTWGLTINE